MAKEIDREELESELKSTFTPAISPLSNCGEDVPNGRALTIAKKSPKNVEVLRLKVDGIPSLDLRCNKIVPSNVENSIVMNNMIYKEYSF